MAKARANDDQGFSKLAEHCAQALQIADPRAMRRNCFAATCLLASIASRKLRPSGASLSGSALSRSTTACWATR